MASKYFCQVMQVGNSIEPSKIIFADELVISLQLRNKLSNAWAHISSAYV